MRSKNEFLRGQGCRALQLHPLVRITANLDPLQKGLHKEIGFKLYHLGSNSILIGCSIETVSIPALGMNAE